MVADVAPTECGAPRRQGQIEPRDILYRPTAFADKVMMRAQIGVKPGRLPLRHHLAHQACLGQRPQIVIDGGARSPRIVAVHRVEDLVRCGVYGVLCQELQNGITLGGRPQGSSLECLIEFGAEFRHSLHLDYIQIVGLSRYEMASSAEKTWNCYDFN